MTSRIISQVELITDATPRCVVRYDDSRADQLTDIPNFTDVGIPVTMCIYAQRVYENENPSGNALNKNQLIQLRKRAASSGTEIEVISHTNTGFSKYGSGSYVNYTDQDIQDELDPIWFDRLGLNHPNYYLSPGDPGLNEWVTSHRIRMEQILRDYGFRGAAGIWKAGVNPYSGAFGLTGQSYIPNTPSQLYEPDAHAFYGGLAGVRPGAVINPFHYGDQFTADLGSKIIGVPVGHPSEATPFVLGRDNSGNGQEGDKRLDAGKLIQFQILRYLGAGLSFQIALHSQRASIAATGGETPAMLLSIHPKDGATDFFELPHSFSLTHLAWILKKLDETGHIKLCTFSEWMRHVSNTYDTGVNLVNHKEGQDLAQRDMQDWSCGEMPFFDGTLNKITSAGDGWSRTHISNVSDLTDPIDPANQDDPLMLDSPPSIDWIGPQIIGPKSKPGGILTHPGGDSVTSSIDFQFNGLHPGNYTLGLTVDFKGITSQLTMQAFGIVGARNIQKNPFFLPSQAFPAYPDEGELEYAFDETTGAPSAGYVQFNVSGDTPNNEIRFPFKIPVDPRPWRGVTYTQTILAIDAGNVSEFNAIAIGVMPGDTIIITTNKHQDFQFNELQVSGRCLIPGVVEVHMKNNTIYSDGPGGHTITPGSTKFGVYYTQRPGSFPAAFRTPAHHDWAWNVGITFKKDGVSEAIFGIPSLIYDGPLLGR